MSELLRIFESGGYHMWVIGTIQLISIAIMLERFYAILFVYNVNGTDLFNKVKKSLLANKVKNAMALCDNKPTAALSQMVKAGLMNFDKPMEDIEKAVDLAALIAVQKIGKRTPYLNTVANVSTLIGLLGTITGLIESFASVGAAAAEERQQLLAAGISVAMYCTAYGLITAIPCIITYSVLQNKGAAIIDDLERYSGVLLDMIKSLKEGGTAPSREVVEEE